MLNSNINSKRYQSLYKDYLVVIIDLIELLIINVQKCVGDVTSINDITKIIYISRNNTYLIS